jgi:hypothetical protein
MLVGIATMAAPFLLGFGTAGGIAALLIGLVIVGAALNTIDTRQINVGAHYALDHVMALAMLLVALALGIFAGDRHATAYLAAAAVVQLGLNVTTRYTAA